MSERITQQDREKSRKIMQVITLKVTQKNKNITYKDYKDVDVDEIIYVKSMKDYVTLFFKNGDSFTFYCTLKKIQLKLACFGFEYLNRSCLVSRSLKIEIRETIKKLKDKRINIGLSQSVIARKINVNNHCISTWESDKHIPDVGSVLKWCNALGEKLILY